MTYIIALLAGIVGAGAGTLIAAYVAGTPHGAMHSLLSLSGPLLIGTMLGLVAGVAAAFRLHGKHKRFWPLAVRTTAVVATLAVVAVGGLRARQAALDYLGINHPLPRLDFQIRLPSEATVPQNRSEIQIALHTDRNQTLATLAPAWLHYDGDRPVLTGQVTLYFRTTQRNLVLSLPGEAQRVFLLRLAGHPSRTETFGVWRPIDFIDDPRLGPPRPASSDDDFDIRYRVRYDD
jgi:hypothetical protein